MFSDLVADTWKVPDLGGQFFPIFGQEKYEFLSTRLSYILATAVRPNYWP